MHKASCGLLSDPESKPEFQCLSAMINKMGFQWCRWFINKYLYIWDTQDYLGDLSCLRMTETQEYLVLVEFIGHAWPKHNPSYCRSQSWQFSCALADTNRCLCGSCVFSSLFLVSSGLSLLCFIIIIVGRNTVNHQCHLAIPWIPIASVSFSFFPLLLDSCVSITDTAVVYYDVTRFMNAYLGCILEYLNEIPSADLLYH